MNSAISASKQSMLLLFLLKPKTSAHNRLLFRLLSTKSDQSQPPSPPTLPLDSRFTTQILTLLSTNEDEWTQNNQLHQLLSSSLSLYNVIRCLPDPVKAFRLFEYIKNKSPALLKTRICNAFIHKLLWHGQIDDAFQVLDEMLKPDSKCPPAENTLDIFIAGLMRGDYDGKTVKEEEIVGLVLKLGENGVFPSSMRLTRLISQLCRSLMSDMAWNVLHELMRLGNDLQTPPFNALLSGLGRENKWEKMNELLLRMKEKGFKPDVVTFGILLNHLCKFRRVDEALVVFTKMSGEDENDGFSVKPDTVICNTLIDGLCKVGRQEEGLSLMEKMSSEHGCGPNSVTYNCLMDGFCKSGEIERANELFEQMKKNEVLPNVITLNTLVDGMCKHGRISSAMEFFNDMRENGLKGNGVTYTTLINAFCKANNISKAMELFDEMLKFDCVPDKILYYTLISGLTQAGRLDEATFVVSEMKKAGFCLDIASYNTLIGGFCRKNKVDKAYEMLNEMEQARVRPDAVTYNTLISFFCKNGDFVTAYRLLENMTKDGLMPSVVTYGALIHAYCLVGDLDKAMKIFEVMSSNLKVPPNTVIYNILIESLCKSEKMEVALSLMGDMKEKGVRPNTNTFNAMLKGLKEMNSIEKAFELMDQMTEHACNPDYITMEILTDWLSAVGETKRLRRFLQGFEVSASARRLWRRE